MNEYFVKEKLADLLGQFMVEVKVSNVKHAVMLYRQLTEVIAALPNGLKGIDIEIESLEPNALEKDLLDKFNIAATAPPAGVIYLK
jgi:hypothetical protein